MKKLVGAWIALIALVSFTSPALAKKPAPEKTDKSHHCVAGNGSELAASNEKDCKKKKGKWEKATTPSPTPAAAAPSDTGGAAPSGSSAPPPS